MSKKRKLPKIAIAGKRNAGKSTLLNALLGEKRAITHDTPGLTRDILEVEVRRDNLHFTLCDTPGLDLPGEEPLADVILRRTRTFLEHVHLTLFLMEPPGPSPFDISFLEYFRKHNQLSRIVFVLNKAEKTSDELALSEFHRAGFPEILTISALGKKNLPALLNRIRSLVPVAEARVRESGRNERATFDSEAEEDDSSSGGPPIAEKVRGLDLVACIVGKPNAGKSSLLNRLTGQDLSLVSEIPGTTRDTVDSIFLFHGQKIKLVDTAGLRPAGRIKDSVEFFSVARTKRAIRRSEVVIHVVDAVSGITDFDKKIVSATDEEQKPMIFAINKWDAAEPKDMKAFLDRLYFFFPHAKNRPVIFCSAQTGVRAAKLIEEALELKKRVHFRIPTPRLNEWLSVWNKRLASSPRKARIYFATQSSDSPPEFVFFVNNKDFFRKDSLQFFENQIRKECGLEGVPIRIQIREKNVARKGGTRAH